MATDPRRLRADRAADDLAAMYLRAQRTIAAQIQTALTSGDLRTARRRRVQLAVVIALLDDLGAATDPIARRMVQEAYEEGDSRTLADLRNVGTARQVSAETFASVSREAVAVMQDAIVGRLDAARRQVGRSVDDVYARAQRRHAMLSMLGAQGSPRTAARQMAQDLLADRDVRRMVRQGGYGFVDRAGRRWKLADYTEMAVRTVIREAATQGAIDRMAAHGVNLARVSVHADPCDICAPWQGRLVSLDGRTRSFQGEAVAGLSALPNGGPPMHPRCKHSLRPVVASVEATRRRVAAGASA